MMTPEIGLVTQVEDFADTRLRWWVCNGEQIPAQYTLYVTCVFNTVFQNSESARQLREGAYVFQLGRAATVRGRVLDPDGQPVAAARILVGHRASPYSRETVCSPDGSFVLTGCQPGENLMFALSPELVITGTVRDAITGQPIPRFKVACGMTAPGSDVPFWDRREGDRTRIFK